VKPKAAAEVEFHEAAQQGHSAVQMKQVRQKQILLMLQTIWLLEWNGECGFLLNAFRMH